MFVYDSGFIFNLNYPKISKATGIVINSDNATRKNQMMMSFQTGILISVASIHGTNAEKKIMADTLTTPTTNLVLIAPLVTNKDGRNISTIEIAEAFASTA